MGQQHAKPPPTPRVAPGRWGDAEVERKIDGLALCKSMRYQKTAKDEIIISQGEEGDAFYAIQHI